MSVLVPGTVFAGHRIESPIGRGGMGVVYRARQLELDRIVALKVIAPELLGDPVFRERFVHEARRAASIEHPNVIPVYYVGEEAEIAYLAMRLVDGHDLRTLVRVDGPLPPTRAAEITAQVAAALDAIHAAGLVHRDVKPANVLLAAADHVYLTDFGLAKPALAAAGATRSGHWVGTLDYVAPEQIRGDRIDARADVYALGGVLHFMLTGHVPFDRESDEAKLWAHVTDPPPAPSRFGLGLPGAFDTVVERAMAKDPDARHPSAGDLGRAARAAVHGVVATAPERVVARGPAAPGGASGSTDVAGEVPTVTSAAAADAGAPPAATRGPADARRRPGRPALAVAALLVLAAVAATVALILAPGAQPPAAETRRPEPQPAGPRVGLTIEHIGRRPNAIAFAAGDLWVTSYEQRWVTRIDAATGRERAAHPRVGRGALDIAAGGGAVWVAVTPESDVVGLSERTGRVTRRIRTPLPPVALAADARGLWVVGRAPDERGPDALLHYDRRGRLVRRLDIADGVAAVTLGAGALWLAELRHGRVLRVDVRTGRAQPWAPLDVPAFALAYGDGYLWASLRDADAVARIDPGSGAVVASAAGNRPAGIAVVGGWVFVASTTDHDVVVIDPETARAVRPRLRVPLNPYAIGAGRGHAWVTGLGTNTVTRLDSG